MARRTGAKIAESERGGSSPAAGPRLPVAGTGAAARGMAAAPISPPHAREKPLPDVHRDVTGTSCCDLGWRAVELIIANVGAWPDKEAARFLRVPLDTYKSWRYRQRKVSVDYLSHLFSHPVFGPGFRAACLAPWSDAGPTVAGFRFGE